MANILLVEDNISTARLVEKVLGRYGHIIHHVGTGLESLDVARSCRPDLVLVDLGLPDLDGKVVAMQLRRTLPSTKTLIVAFTAETGNKARWLARAYGCDDYMTKPIDTRAFPNQIAQLLQRIGIAPADSQEVPDDESGSAPQLA